MKPPEVEEDAGIELTVQLKPKFEEGDIVTFHREGMTMLDFLSSRGPHQVIKSMGKGAYMIKSSRRVVRYVQDWELEKRKLSRTPGFRLFFENLMRKKGGFVQTSRGRPGSFRRSDQESL